MALQTYWDTLCPLAGLDLYPFADLLSRGRLGPQRFSPTHAGEQLALLLKANALEDRMLPFYPSRGLALCRLAKATLISMSSLGEKSPMSSAATAKPLKGLMLRMRFGSNHPELGLPSFNPIPSNGSHWQGLRLGFAHLTRRMEASSIYQVSR